MPVTGGGDSKACIQRDVRESTGTFCECSHLVVREGAVIDAGFILQHVSAFARGHQRKGCVGDGWHAVEVATRDGPGGDLLAIDPDGELLGHRVPACGEVVPVGEVDGVERDGLGMRSASVIDEVGHELVGVGQQVDV